MERRRVGRSDRLVAALGAVVLVAAGCGDDTSDLRVGPDTPVIVATTGIWADVVANVACEGLVTVQTLIPTGGDPHAFQASLADRARLESAALVVANGLKLEASLDDVLDAVEAEGTPVLRLAEQVHTVGSPAPADGEDAYDADPHAGADPHVWFDPTLVSNALPALAGRLVDEAGLDVTKVNRCLSDYRVELARVDTEIGEWMAAIPPDRRKLVTNHDSLAYFADRYGLDIVGTVIPSSSTLTETNPAALEELAELIGTMGVRVVFSEADQSADDAEALVERAGDVELVTLLTDGLGEPGRGVDTYVGLLRTMARRIADALG